MRGHWNEGAGACLGMMENLVGVGVRGLLLGRLLPAEGVEGAESRIG